VTDDAKVGLNYVGIKEMLDLDEIGDGRFDSRSSNVPKLGGN
jgi:hypothetical protein